MELEIINMYSDILNLYGDIGNLICIKKRCEWRGINVNIKNFTVDAEIDLQMADIILISGGSDNGQEIISKHILNQRESLEKFIEDEKVLLAICGSYQIFGSSYTDPYNLKIPCLEIFDIETESRKDRLIGNTVISNNLNSTLTYDLNDIIGFENHGGRSYHNYDVLGDVKIGFGNNGQDGKEGMIYKNFIGSYLHGPLLPKNPHVADHMIFTALKNRYGVDCLEGNMFQKDTHLIDDNVEIEAHNSIKKRLLNRRFF